MAKKTDVSFRGNTYFKEAWKMKGLAKWARTQLPEDVDTLVGTGLSGSLVVPRLAHTLGLSWGIVRKEKEDNHAMGHKYEGQMGRKWAMVDDFVCTGDTVVRVVEEVHHEFVNNKWRMPWATEFAGILCYSNWDRALYSQDFRDQEGTLGLMSLRNAQRLQKLWRPEPVVSLAKSSLVV